ncbi:MAG: protein-disulfide reductase DsbD family protein [Hyphomicrobiales bacterium]|nr:protein-disulfide reductase DsbD family protein [Hyphomicrobiales bacterium]
MVRGIIALALAFCGWAGAYAAPAPIVKARLTADVAAVAPGQSFWVAIHQDIRPGWHTYWVNPGDAGEPLTVEWSLPPGFTAGEIQFPVPDVIPVASLVNYGYSNNAVMLVRVQAPATTPARPFEIKARARWLVCEEVCIPEEAELSLTLSPGETFASADAGAIAAAAAKLPGPSPWLASAEAGAEAIRLTLAGAGASVGARFFPLDWGHVDNAAPQSVAPAGGDLVLTLQRGELKSSSPAPLKGLIVMGRDEDRRGYWVEAPVRSVASLGFAPAAADADGAGGGLGLLGAVAFAFLGGAILNFMPCVFPILAIKAMSLAGAARGEGRRHGFAYLAGVMAAFAAVAAIVIALKESGAAFGWGFQFQSPAFVLFMAVLFLGLGLSLSGVFHLGGGLCRAGEGMTRRGGVSGVFFTGVLATIAATPCTGPFMGAALGYAFAQPPVETLAVILALGLGFAAPMTALGVAPGVARLLPRPGPWMETLKQAMAFPLYATAAWLVWVLSVQRGSDGVLAAGVGLLGVGVACWLWGRANGPSLRAAALAFLAAALTASATLLPDEARGPAAVAASGRGPAPEPYSATRLAELRGQGRPVFVNFTAAWCVTCKANERLALSSARMREAFSAAGVVYLKADWTTYDADITAALKSFGRAGVPLYVLYPPNSGEPDVLPQILTEAMIVDRLGRFSPNQATGVASHAR